MADDMLYVNEYSGGDGGLELPAVIELAIPLSDEAQAIDAIGGTTAWIELYCPIDFALAATTDATQVIAASPTQHVLPGGQVHRYRVRRGTRLSVIRA